MNKILKGLAGTFAVLLCLGIIKYFQISAAIAENANRGMPPETVTSALAQSESWAGIQRAIGSLAASEGAMLSAESGGRVSKINFESGQSVEAGSVLIELDSSVEEADLGGLRSQLELAEITLKRQQALRKRNANSKSDLDAAEANARSLRSEVARIEAVIEKKKVIAPFSGRAGIRRVNVGSMLSTGSEVVEVMALDPLFMDFDLPQQSLASIKIGQKVIAEIDAFPGKQFEGILTAIDSSIDSSSRNIRLQGTLANPDKLLVPGMFARVSLIDEKQREVITVPTSSVSFAPYGNTINVIAGGEAAAPREVEGRTVRLGERRGDRIVVLKGIAAGEEVVSSGAFKLYPGAKVLVNNSVQPKNELSPKPQDA